MGNVLRLAIVDPHDATRERLKSMLLGMEMVWLEAECSRYEFFADVVSQTHPDIGVVCIDHNPERALQLIQEIHQQASECTILVVSSSTDGQMILRAMRAGAKEFLTQPVNVDDLVAALERVGSQRLRGGDVRARGCSITAVAGATGGVGATSLAVNMGCYLARQPQNSVLLIDLDLSLGDADVFLDTIPDYTLVDVAQNLSRLDFALLKKSLTRHSSGLYLLPRPVQLQDCALVSPDSLQRMFGLLKASFTHVIIDLSKAYNELDMTALQLASQVLLVTQLDLPCLRNVVRLLVSFDAYEGLKEKVRVVVNRVGLETGSISLKKAQETIGREIFWQIPNDYRVMVDVRNNGVSLIDHAPRANVTQSITGLADELSGHSKPAKPPATGNSRWLGFWPKRSKGKEPEKPQGRQESPAK